jgi:hypothetical protein
VNQPPNWSQVPNRTEGKARIKWPRIDPEICDRSSRCESRDGFMEHARHPQALIGNPPPLWIIVERRRALLRRALPLSRARS